MESKKDELDRLLESQSIDRRPDLKEEFITMKDGKPAQINLKGVSFNDKTVKR